MTRALYDARWNVVVLLVVAATLTGTLWQASGASESVIRGGDEPTFNPGVGGPNDVVVSDRTPVLYQGERNIDLHTPDGGRLSPGRLVGSTGDAEGVPLQLPVPREQPVGQYTLGGDSNDPGVVVQTPRVTEFEVLNRHGFDVRGATVTEDEALLVAAQWNYKRAEDLSLVVRNERDVDITGEVLASVEALSSTQHAELSGPYAASPDRVGTVSERGTGTGVEYLQGLGQFSIDERANSSQLDSAFWVLDLDDAGPGNVTIRVEGWDTLNHGPASRSGTVRVSSDTDPSLSLASDEATRGQRVEFSVRGSTIGATHTVTVEDEAFRDEPDERVFESVNDVVDRGTVDTDDDGTADLAYGIVQINDDTGFGAGRLDTSYLDDTSVEVAVFGVEATPETVAGDTSEAVDERTLDVREPTLGIDRPAGTYVAGSETDVRGTASRGIDEVALYVRLADNWRLLDIDEDGSVTDADTVTVASDGTWEQTDVLLSETSRLLTLPGQYELGVVEAQDVRSDGGLPATLTDAEFNGVTNRRTTLVVTPPRLRSGRTFTTVDDQVAVEDGTVDVRGTAPGLERVLVVLIDEDGQLTTEQVAVDDDDVFEQGDIELSTAAGQSLSRGRVVGLLLGVGRDNVVGDGHLPRQDRATLSAFEDYLKALSERGHAQAQLVNGVVAQTINDTASDDLLIRESFRYVDATARVTAVVPEQFGNETGIHQIEVGETMVVRGQTNRQHDHARITVEAIRGPTPRALSFASTADWGANGTWRVLIGTDAAEPGNYTLEVSDGATTDQVTIQLVAPGDRGSDDAATTDTAAD